MEVAVLREVSSALPFSLSFWNISWWNSRNWHCERRAWYVSWDWSCWCIKSQALCHTACCRTMILSVSLVFRLGNIHRLIRVVMHVLRVWIPSLGPWYTSERSLSQKCQKWSLDIMVVAMASNTCLWVFWCLGVMVSLSRSV